MWCYFKGTAQSYIIVLQLEILQYEKNLESFHFFSSIEWIFWTKRFESSVIVLQINENNIAEMKQHLALR